MNRSELLRGTAALGLFYAAFPKATLASPSDSIPVAFLLSDGAVMIDFAGPWEVFQDARVPSATMAAFDLYTVGQSTQPVTMSAGAKLVPQYSFLNAPPPRIVVVPGQGPPTQPMLDWVRGVSHHADVMMSVCTGAFVLAAAGLLDGHTVTTHHGSFSTLAMQYSSLTVKRGVRFVDDGHVATSAGLSAGIDLALHIVSRYLGPAAARGTAYDMEYLSQAWTDPRSNHQYAKPPVAKAGEAICPVCWMNVDPKISPSSAYRGKHYYFCMAAHKQRFDATPATFLG